MRNRKNISTYLTTKNETILGVRERRVTQIIFLRENNEGKRAVISYWDAKTGELLAERDPIEGETLNPFR